MAVSSRALVDLILLGTPESKRQLQDSPILGDVWAAYAVHPCRPLDLLITPYKDQPAGTVAAELARRISEKITFPRGQGEMADVAYLQGFIAARLYFSEVLKIAVPMTRWWIEKKIGKKFDLDAYIETTLKPEIETIIKWARSNEESSRLNHSQYLTKFSALDRYAALSSIILFACKKGNNETGSDNNIGKLIEEINEAEPFINEFRNIIEEIRQGKILQEARIWQISLNRKVMMALDKSVPSVKGDAVKTLFNVKCDGIAWAVLDSGIDGKHPVFRDKNGKSRIVKAYDFRNIRKIISLENLNTKSQGFKKSLDELKKNSGNALSDAIITKLLKDLAVDADNDRPINWGLVEKLIEIDPGSTPSGGHGTHVAGIIGANRGDNTDFADGMCPDIKLYDFRVIGNSLEDTEFAIIAALQFIRYLNERHDYISIHGANLSLSIPHDVRNFACGQTPVCNECQRLVDNGVVVVAAAGNFGYHNYETKDGYYEGYAAFSITDPGNTDEVITVGATHRYRPHTYGVSFFSSRGPTGDGRLKPDMVAPGERIQSSLPEEDWGELDGTSMAAPHVSGAAALLMARYSELIGQPQRIKKILCESATDLNRERSFQGYGMLDVLRAFQKI